MTPLVLIDEDDEEVGRCNIESRVTFATGHSIDLGPVGYFRILDVRSNGDPRVLVVEATDPIAPGALL